MIAVPNCVLARRRYINSNDSPVRGIRPNNDGLFSVRAWRRPWNHVFMRERGKFGMQTGEVYVYQKTREEAIKHDASDIL